MRPITYSEPCTVCCPVRYVFAYSQVEGRKGVQSRHTQTSAAIPISWSQRSSETRQALTDRSQRTATTGIGTRKKKYFDAIIAPSDAAARTSYLRGLRPSSAAALASAR